MGKALRLLLHAVWLKRNSPRCSRFFEVLDKRDRKG